MSEPAARKLETRNSKLEPGDRREPGALPASVPGRCADDGGCPVRRLWPSSKAGKAVVLLVAVAALAVVAAHELLRSDLSKMEARWEGLRAAGRKDEAAKVMGDVIGEGVKLYRERRFDEAKGVFEWAVKNDPNRPLALSYLGVIARTQGDNDAAIGWHRKAAEIDPLSPLHFYNLAEIYYRRHEYQACEAELEQAMKLAPIKSEYRYLYALCAAESGQPAEVVKKRLRETISAAEAQAQAVPAEALAPDGALAWVWKEAAKRLAALGDDYGWQKLRKLSTESKKPEVRAFAKALLAGKKVTSNK